MMKMFLDDERFPAGCDDGSWKRINAVFNNVYHNDLYIHGDWVIARTVESAIAWCETTGRPDFISFDHDLGTEKTGMDFAHYLVNRDLDFKEIGRNFLPDNFDFYVHSQNVNDAANINGLLTNYFKQR